jgi:hypothetical protein
MEMTIAETEGACADRLRLLSARAASSTWSKLVEEKIPGPEISRPGACHVEPSNHQYR